jgi:hypothetical protein
MNKMKQIFLELDFVLYNSFKQFEISRQNFKALKFKERFFLNEYAGIHSSISEVSISAVFDLPRLIILSYFPPL